MAVPHWHFLHGELDKVERALTRDDEAGRQRLADQAGNLALALPELERRRGLGLGPVEVACRDCAPVGDGRRLYGRVVRLEARLRRGRAEMPQELAQRAGRRGHALAQRLIDRHKGHFGTLADSRPVVQNVPLSFVLALIVARLAA
jgi:hypothetical protein